ncbi:TPA: LuxR C-terminal-related transcriptional regulator [Yersinia enterocolitica]|nr:response regulator transcription factor [Yersinia enterocolitica]HEN3580542.1 response regulator transcription factor [Yersinia enterocolitica]HEN3613773.1 response regulator transcription factor [Yersinia enterocolitica]HEN3639323.1 response regulator transcription factor [Yersinia enterocolitica]HEN3647600.1 response regulator transcription factor [Yersinia enterocolitica]
MNSISFSEARTKNGRVLKLAIVDQYPLFRLGLKNIISTLLSKSCIEFKVEETSLQRMAEILPFTDVDILITELCGTESDLVQDITILQRLCLNYELRIIVLTRIKDGQTLNILNELESVSLISKVESLENTQQYLTFALNDQKVCSPLIHNYIECYNSKEHARLEALTRCERRILLYLFNGYSITYIASLTKRSIKTVSCHKCNAMRKLGVKSYMELFLIKNELFLIND